MVFLFYTAFSVNLDFEVKLNGERTVFDMLDIKLVRANPEIVEDSLKRRGMDVALLTRVLSLDEKRRAILVEVEALKRRRNEVSEEVARLKKNRENADDLIKEMRGVSDRIKEMDSELSQIEADIREAMLAIPNIPHPSVHTGKDESENIEVCRWGEPRKFDFDPLPHWDLGTSLDIIDFERAGKITGARFAIYKGMGSRLVRGLINFMLDLHTIQHGYTEVLPPFMVNRASMVGTGQLPKFAEDMFKVEDTDYYLIPTAEVPVTNMYRGEILDEELLPVKHCAYTACFRAEAGSAGRDTRGLIRQHEFDKIELVKFVKPETSYEELDKLVADAESVLEELELPYRLTKMCTGDVGFSAAKKFDVEVWMPSYNRYVEISSCSNFESFQARRADIKYRPQQGGKSEYLHTLNGSGLAVGRTLAAIMENYQNADGSITVPAKLRPYVGGVEVVK